MLVKKLLKLECRMYQGVIPCKYRVLTEMKFWTSLFPSDLTIYQANNFAAFL